MDIDLDRLRLFIAIVEEGSLTEAARRMHMTQPAASRGLKQLEDAIGAPLFDRVGRGLEITSAGRALTPQAHGLLTQAQTLTRVVRQAARDDHFNLRVGTTDSIALNLLPRLARPLREAFEGLQLQWSTGRSAHLLEQVRLGELDVVVVASSSAPAGEDVRRLGPYRMAYYGLDANFHTLNEVTHEDQLTAFPIVELIALPGQPTLIAEHTTSYARVGSLATVKSMVLSGFGVGALLDFMLTDDERATLARADITHDPDCALFLMRAERFSSPRSLEIVALITATLQAALAKAP